MGYAQRLKDRTRDISEHRNGKEPLDNIDPHQPWCPAFHMIGADCACYAMPALKCNDCGAVFVPEPGESPKHYGSRVRAHAMVHPGGEPGFIQGRVERTAPVDPEAT